MCNPVLEKRERECVLAHPEDQKHATRSILLSYLGVCGWRSDRVTKVGVAEEDQDQEFDMGVQFLRLVGAPGTGKSTALQELFRYICQHFDRLSELLPLPPAAVAVLRQRVKSCFSCERFLSFTFSNAGGEQLH